VSGRRLPCASDHPNVLCFRTLLALSNLELDALTFIQALITVALDCGEVDEHVVALFAGDETVTLFGVEELHCALCHKYSFLSAADQLVRSARKVNPTRRCRDRPRGWRSTAVGH
jgi:hypothetical protein